MSRRRVHLGVLLVIVTAAAGIVAVTGSVPNVADAGSVGATTADSSTLARCPWLDNSVAVPTRVAELLRAMTPLQEATLLHLRQYDPAIGYEGYTPAIPELCIPMITEQDGAAGVATGMTQVTQLPAPISDAAAFDPTLASLYGSVIGSEDAAKGIDLALSPTINIDRSPLWGRSYETLGEDPYLTATLAAPLIRGIQSNRVVSVVKHFAVYNQETARSTSADDAIVSERALHEIYLPAFAAAVLNGNAGAMMCSYNLINGTPACQDASLIDGVLRQDWHFQGFVRSDCNSVYAQGPAIAVGVSQVKCTPLYNPTALAAAVASGRLPRSTLDGLARPLLTVLMTYNLIGDPHPLEADDVATSAAHRAVALKAAEEGAVLLKNSGSLLPLNLARVGSLALIGPADGTPMPAGFGAMHVLPTSPVTALAALRGAIGARVRYASGSDIAAAASLARKSQIAVVVVNDVEAERHDRTTLALPAGQDELVSAVAAANPHTIVVLETGSAVLMPWLRSVPAVLETWYPGETAGTALVDLLSGRVDPSGKLPVSFPVSQSAMPDSTPATFGGINGHTLYRDDIAVGYRWYQRSGVAPAFPFGFGLSYTQFRFSHLQVRPARGGDVTVSVTITNNGPVAGADVVQCYVGDPPAVGEPPRQLRGYQRVVLGPGQSQRVTMTLRPDDLATWNSSRHRFVVTAGTYTVSVGDASDAASLPLSASLPIGAATLASDARPGLS